MVAWSHVLVHESAFCHSRSWLFIGKLALHKCIGLLFSAIHGVIHKLTVKFFCMILNLVIINVVVLCIKDNVNSMLGNIYSNLASKISIVDLWDSKVFHLYQIETGKINYKSLSESKARQLKYSWHHTKYKIFYIKAVEINNLLINCI